MREREMAQMLKQADQIKVDEQRMLDAIQVKDQRKKEEKDLEQKIIDYNRAKAQREEEKAAEIKRVKEEKEREVARLRELQEKAADRQAEIDALRAKRAFEEGERGAREKERRDLEHKQKVLRDMEDARQRQFLERETRLAEQAKQERDEFLNIIQKQKEIEEQERLIEEEKKEVLKKHSYQLRTQIQLNDEKSKQDRLDYLEEGRKVRQKIDEERRKIEAIK